MENADRVVAIPWFASLEAEVRSSLIARGQWRRRQAGEWLYGEGDEDTGIVAVIEGLVHLHAQAPGGREVLFGVLQPGELIGQSIVFGGGPRLVTAICARDSTLFVVADQALRLTAEAHPLLWRGLLSLAYLQQRRLVESIAAQIGLKPHQRLVAQLLRLSNRGREAPVSQSVLAELVGASRKAVNGWLAELEAQHLIRRGYGGLVVEDRVRLARLLDE